MQWSGPLGAAVLSACVVVVGCGRPMAGDLTPARSVKRLAGPPVVLVQHGQPKAAAEPTIDGKLDEAVWANAKEVTFIRATDQAKPECQFPTTLKAVWTFGNFTRHRVCDGKEREYQRLNTTFAGPSNNMMAFGPIRFTE